MRPIPPLLAAVLVASIGFPLQGCDLLPFRACTLVGYSEGFHLRLVRPAWDPAAYRIEGRFDDEPFACDLNLAYVATCQPASVSFGGWTEEDHLVFSSNPRHLEVAVYRAGERLGEGSFRPSYLHDEPNGEGCGERLFAQVELALPGPTPCGIDETCRCVHADGCGCETDQVRPYPWSTCAPGTIPADPCDPSTCGCSGQPSRCLPRCGADTVWPERQVCVDGVWTCADPEFPIAMTDCG